MVSFVTFLWNNGFRNYRPEHVNILANAVKYFCPWPHRFICITDEPHKEFNKNVEYYPTPKAAKRLRNIEAPQGRNFPSCYCRLWLFSEAARELGDRILLMDVDCMVLQDLQPLFAIDADFVGWRPISIWGREGRIGGGTWALKTGKVTRLWDEFNENPAKMILETRELGWNGSDQAIMSRFLAHKYPVWPQMSGIYGVADGVFEWDLPPKDSRIVHFNSDDKPWAQKKLWMKAYCDYFGNLNEYAEENRKCIVPYPDVYPHLHSFLNSSAPRQQVRAGQQNL